MMIVILLLLNAKRDNYLVTYKREAF